MSAGGCRCLAWLSVSLSVGLQKLSMDRRTSSVAATQLCYLRKCTAVVYQRDACERCQLRTALPRFHRECRLGCTLKRVSAGRWAA